MEIPYNVSARPDTGLYNAKLGIWLFLAAEMMLFGALFSSYALLRVAAPDWPSGRDVLSVTIGAVNTAVPRNEASQVSRVKAVTQKKPFSTTPATRYA